MLRLRASTIEAFLNEVHREFEERVVPRLRDHFPTLASRPTDALRCFVQEARSRAHSYGIRSPYGVALYVGIMAELGEDFDTSGKNPWAEEILASHRTGNEKVMAICDRLTSTDRPGR